MFGIDLDQMWSQAKQAAEQGMNDLLQIGGNSALGYLEKQAADTMRAFANQVDHQSGISEARAQTAIKEAMQRPSSADSFGAYFSNLASSPALQTYGPTIMIAVGAVVAVTLMMRGR